MEKLKNNIEIYNTLEKLFPNAKCELEYKNTYELIVAVVLSAQTTDKRVNIVTKELFKKYPDVNCLSKASEEDVNTIISSLGLSKMKSKNIIELSKQLINKYNGIVPNDMENLLSLHGVGRKTASVVLSVGYNIPAIAVDTHVSRVSNRLGLSDSSSVVEIEKDLKSQFDKKIWGEVHHLLLFFGRYLCKAKKPDCQICPFINICKINNKKK